MKDNEKSRLETFLKSKGYKVDSADTQQKNKRKTHTGIIQRR